MTDDDFRFLDRLFITHLEALAEAVALLQRKAETEGIPQAAYRAADAAGSSGSLVLLATRVVMAAAQAQAPYEPVVNGCTRPQ